jgi:glycosyltransferase involved in cell wall biosynthesis
MQLNGVTIGIPLFNEVRHIEAAIHSAAGQCEALVISDNGSEDGSSTICQKVCGEYQHATYIRHSSNQGSSFNFHFLLERARTPYFMWLGGHDLIPEMYVARLRHALHARPDAVLAYGTARHIDATGLQIAQYGYDYHRLLSADSPTVRLLGLIRFLSDCSLIHGVFRTSAIQSAWTNEQCLGADHVLLAKAALIGTFIYVPESYLLRRTVRTGDTPEAQLLRVRGSASMNTPPSYAPMQRMLYALAIETAQEQGWSGLETRLKARYFLTRRFGPFAETLVGRKLEHLALSVISTTRTASRLIRSR